MLVETWDLVSGEGSGVGLDCVSGAVWGEEWDEEWGEVCADE